MKVSIKGNEYGVLAVGTYITKSAPDKPYKKYKLNNNKVLVVSEKENFAYFGEDFGDLGIEPRSEKINYKNKEFTLNANDNQILQSVEFGNPEGDVEFWDYETGDELISIGLDENNQRIDVVGNIFSKNEIIFKE